MEKPVIEIENLSKLYRLGVIGATTLQESVQRWWYRMRSKEEMLQKIGAKHRMIEPNDPRAGPEPNTVWALKDISLSVQQGEIIGIIGKNGAGKSTLLKILTRITEPTSGRAILRGRVSSLLEVGTGFHPELTGRENVYLNGTMLGMRKFEIERKFDKIVEFSGIGIYIDTPVKRYSSGMYVRLAFAVAAHLEPDILLVDEVLSVGDAEFQKKCLGKMKDIAEGGRTVLFVSHIMPSIKELCSKAILLEEGRITKSGTAHEIVSHYLSSSLSPKKSATVDLKNYKDRQGTQNVMFEWVQLLNSEGKPCREFFIGDDIIILVGIRNNSPDLGGYLHVIISIHSSDGIPLCHMKSYYDEEKFPMRRIKDSIVISSTLEDIRFYNDKYLITLRASVGDGLDDCIENCLDFEIIVGGRLAKDRLPRREGLIFLTPEWKQEDITAPID